HDTHRVYHLEGDNFSCVCFILQGFLDLNSQVTMTGWEKPNLIWLMTFLITTIRMIILISHNLFMVSFS
ncbi:unnamed protein product, partial [Bubo scandiacus]